MEINLFIEDIFATIGILIVAYVIWYIFKDNKQSNQNKYENQVVYICGYERIMHENTKSAYYFIHHVLEMEDTVFGQKIVFYGQEWKNGRWGPIEKHYIASVYNGLERFYTKGEFELLKDK